MISISFSLRHDETDNVIDHSKSLGYFLLPSSPPFPKVLGYLPIFSWTFGISAKRVPVYSTTRKIHSKSASFYVAKCIITSIFSSLNYSLIFWKIPQIAWKNPIKWDGIIDLFSTLTANKKSDTLQTKNYWKEYQKKNRNLLLFTDHQLYKKFLIY